MLITKLSGLLRRLLRSTDHFVTLREEIDAILFFGEAPLERRAFLMVS